MANGNGDGLHFGYGHTQYCSDAPNLEDDAESSERDKLLCVFGMLFPLALTWGIPYGPTRRSERAGEVGTPPGQSSTKCQEI